MEVFVLNPIRVIYGGGKLTVHPILTLCRDCILTKPPSLLNLCHWRDWAHIYWGGVYIAVPLSHTFTTLYLQNFHNPLPPKPIFKFYFVACIRISSLPVLLNLNYFSITTNDHHLKKFSILCVLTLVVCLPVWQQHP